jgi:Tfp pilus assembly protein PilF
VQGYNFLIPISVAKSFINQLNINTSRSKSSDYIEKGLDYYWKQQYSNAAQEFNKALSLDSKNYYVSEYLKMISPQ